MEKGTTTTWYFILCKIFDRSGGERKRTDLVMLFAMFDLIRLHSRYQPQFMFLDEVFDSLDINGLKSVQHILQSLSENLKKLFIITHSETIKEFPLTGRLTCVMQRDDKGSPLGTTYFVE